MSPSNRGRELPGDLPVESARDLVLAGIEPLVPVEVPLNLATGRVTAEPTVAPASVPPFDASAMDGFAVRAADCLPENGGNPGAADAELAIAGESSAGTPWTGSVESGRAVAISTGAEVPPGADAVVRIEDTERRGGTVIVRPVVRSGQNIRFRGEVAGAGTEILPAGRRIGPVEVGLLASAGNDPVLCHSRPTVAIVVTGDELVAPGVPVGPGQIWNSNLPVISTMVRGAGGEIVSATTVGDSAAEVRAALETALDSDLTVVCGGVSVGEHDHVKGTLAALEVERSFWGVAVKPGRPVWYGTRGGSRVLGLPGNPVSVIALFALLGSPLLKALSGDSAADEIVRGCLLFAVDRHPDRLIVAPCGLDHGSAVAGLQPIVIKGSHDFISLAGCRALALVGPGVGCAAAGTEVEMIPLFPERC